MIWSQSKIGPQFGRDATLVVISEDRQSVMCCRAGRCQLKHRQFDMECIHKLEMWTNAQRDGRPAEYRWRRLFNAAKFA